MAPRRDIAGNQAAAKAAGLHYVLRASRDLADSRVERRSPIATRRGARVRDPRTLDRIRSLVIPPAWNDVWICARADGHLQATGRDARGRKQHRYHPEWTGSRATTRSSAR